MLTVLLFALAADPTLTDLVRQNFDAWDVDHNGVLSPAEVDDLTTNPQVRAETAAAVATLKLAMRRKTDPMKELPKAALDTALTFKPPAQGQPQREEDDDAQVQNAPFDMDRRFRVSLRRIKNAQRTPFADEIPDIATFHQGPLGDCYFVSMVGALAHHHPDRVRAMVSVAPDGAGTVTFPGKPPVEVKPLTDTQLAISSTAGKDGAWLPVIENALGAYRQRTRPDRADDGPTDLISRGGSTADSIELITGHDTDRFMLGGLADKPLDDAQVAEKVAKLRELLPGIVEQKKLAAVGTAKEGTPPGVSPSHAYAVLGFDAATDRVTLWNPHGNNFKPKGEPGIKNGYPTKAGQFTMPIAEFVRVFRGFSYETDRPAAPSPTRKPAAKKPPQTN